MISFDYAFMLQNVGLWRHNGRLCESGSNFFSFFIFFFPLFYPLFFKVCQCLSVCTVVPAGPKEKHQRRQRKGEKKPQQNKSCPPCPGEAGTGMATIQQHLCRAHLKRQMKPDFRFLLVILTSGVIFPP